MLLNSSAAYVHYTSNEVNAVVVFQVDEVIEDPVFNAANNMDDTDIGEDSPFARPNGAVPSTKGDLKHDQAGNGENKMADEERKSLMKSEEKPRTVVV